MPVIKNVEILKGRYTDRDIIEFLNEPNMEAYLKDLGVNNIACWKHIGTELKKDLKDYTMNIGAIQKNISMRVKRYNNGEET